MNKLKLIMLMTILSLSASFVSAQSTQACTKSSGTTIKIESAASSNPFKTLSARATDACAEIPDNYRINIFKFGLCTGNPMTANDFSSCSYIVNSDAAVTHNITGVGTGTALATNSTLASGTYGYMVIVLANKLEIKHTQTYDGTIYAKPNGGTETSGVKCWSLADYGTSYGNWGTEFDLKGSSDSAGLTCGAADATQVNFGYTSETFDTMGEGEGEGAWTAEADIFAVDAGSMDARLLQTNETTATSHVNAAKLMAVVDFTANKVITPNSQIELKFKLTDAVSVDHSKNGSKIYAVKLGADPFQVDFVVTN